MCRRLNFYSITTPGIFGSGHVGCKNLTQKMFFSELHSLKVWGDHYMTAYYFWEWQIKVTKAIDYVYSQNQASSIFGDFRVSNFCISVVIIVKQVFTSLKKASENLPEWKLYFFKCGRVLSIETWNTYGCCQQKNPSYQILLMQSMFSFWLPKLICFFMYYT